MLKRRLQRLARVYTCQNATLLEISCAGSYIADKTGSSCSIGICNIDTWSFCVCVFSVDKIIHHKSVSDIYGDIWATRDILNGKGL